MHKNLRFVYNYPWAWKDLQSIDPTPSNLQIAATYIVRGSQMHKLFKEKIDKEMGSKGRRGVSFPTLIRMVAAAMP